MGINYVVPLGLILLSGKILIDLHRLQVGFLILCSNPYFLGRGAVVCLVKRREEGSQTTLLKFAM